MSTRYTHHKTHKTCNICGSNLDFGESCDCDPVEVAHQKSVKHIVKSPVESYVKRMRGATYGKLGEFPVINPHLTQEDIDTLSASVVYPNGDLDDHDPLDYAPYGRIAKGELLGRCLDD